MNGPTYVYIAQSVTLDGSKTIKSDGYMYDTAGGTLSEVDVTRHALQMIADTSEIAQEDLVLTSFMYVEDPEERNPSCETPPK